jgi:hypothetical protein
MFSTHGNAAGKTCYAATAFINLHICTPYQPFRFLEVLSRIYDCLCYLSLLHA